MSGTIVAGVVGSIAGGMIASRGSKDAAKTQASAMRDASEVIAEQVKVAREDIKKLQQPAERNLLAGAQAAMGTLGATLPQQMKLAQGGNVAAQQTLAQGMPQYQSAVLGTGLPTAPGPVSLDYQLPEATLPQFQSTESALGGQFDYVQTPEEYQAGIEAQPQTPTDPFTGTPLDMFNDYGNWRGFGTRSRY